MTDRRRDSDRPRPKRRPAGEDPERPALHRLFGHLAAFSYFARAGSIQDAARELGLSRNSLSRYLTELEEWAGGPPLRQQDPDSRQAVLTEPGRRLAEMLAPLFQRLETASDALAAGIQELRLGCQSSTSCYLLPGWIQSFGLTRGSASDRGDVPKFTLKTGSSESVLAALRSLEIDLGIVAADLRPAATEPGVALDLLFRETLVAICPRDHPLAGEGRVAADRFIQHPQYLYYRGGTQYQDRINGLAPPHGASRQMEFDTIAAIKETVRAGLGISIIPGGALRAEDMAWMARVRLETPEERAALLVRAIAIATRAGDELTPLASQFVQFLKTHQRELAESWSR